MCVCLNVHIYNYRCKKWETMLREFLAHNPFYDRHMIVHRKNANQNR